MDILKQLLLAVLACLTGATGAAQGQTAINSREPPLGGCAHCWRVSR
jgi:hypothetical protein